MPCLDVTLKLQMRERIVLINRQETRAGEIPRYFSSCEVGFIFNNGMRQQKRKDSGIHILCSLNSTGKMFMFCMQHWEQNRWIGFKDVQYLCCSERCLLTNCML